MSRVVYMDGTFIPESEAKLSIYDLSVMQAAAAFEMTRSFGGKHFKLLEHLQRLQRSCELLSIPLPDWPDMYGPEHFWTNRLEVLCHEVAHLNDHGPGEEHRLLIVVSPGCAPMYRELEGTIDHPYVYIADFPLSMTTKGFSRYFLDGVHCVTSPIQQVPDACVPSAAKHRSRLHFHLAQQQAPPGTWPILRDDRGYYREAPGANLMYVIQGKVYAQGVHALPGISMQTAMELTDARYCAWTENEVLDELWLTGTPFAMVPVVSLDGQPIGDGKIGPVYRDTLAKWKALVNCDFEQQIIAWDAQKVWTPEQQRSEHASQNK